MINRFETFVTTINQIYRAIQKIKSQEMAKFGLKGAHVMCLYQLAQHPEGLSATELVRLCEEDKAAVSRALAELRAAELVAAEEGQRYRARMTLTDQGWGVTARMDQRIMEAVTAGAKGYSQKEREIFYHVLLQISENLKRTSGTKEEL